jgi:Regulator of ribonuclease activity B
MTWYFVALVAALALVGARVIVKLRAAGKSRSETWDEQLIGRLRQQGYAPFREYPVDFFLALPDEMACEGARAQLEPEFKVDIKPLTDDREYRYSLHATKTMHLIVPEMLGVRRRLTALAGQLKGRYDGWAA